MASGPEAQDRSVFLNACLLEGDSEKEKRARRIKQRAILVSIVLQILVVAALILLPLLGKSENIAGRIFVPTVPYSPAGHPHPNEPRRHTSPTPNVCRFCAPTQIPPNITMHDHTPQSTSSEPDGTIIPGTDSREGVIGANPFADTRPQPPQPPTPPPATIRRSVSGAVEAAMLIHRIEPSYPALARQMHLEGRVELHAIISTDGNIQSLEVLSGHPLFVQSSLDAVRQWRYRPTTINGQPIEVDTHITVIYTLSH